MFKLVLAALAVQTGTKFHGVAKFRIQFALVPDPIVMMPPLSLPTTDPVPPQSDCTETDDVANPICPVNVLVPMEATPTERVLVEDVYVRAEYPVTVLELLNTER